MSQDQAVDDQTRATVDAFGEALNRQDLAAMERLLAHDTIFENTSPQPDGTRYEGRPAVLEFWRSWIARNPGARFDTEDMIVAGDRAVVQWIYRKTRDGRSWHLRGIDVFTVRQGKVAAKLSYVKG